MRARWVPLLLLTATLVGCPDDDDDPDLGARVDGAMGDVGRPDSGTDQGPDAETPADGGRDDGGPVADLGVLPAPVEAAPAPLFDPEAPDAVEVDRHLAALVEAWQASPSTEEEARAQQAALAEAQRAIAGVEAADRVVARCRPVPVHADRALLICLRLLSLTESDNSLMWLGDLARLPVPRPPEGSHPHDPAPEALANQVAAWSLGRRAKAGSERALEILLRVVADPETPDKRHAIKAIYRALPRVRAQARLRAALPAAEHYRLYEHR